MSQHDSPMDVIIGANFNEVRAQAYEECAQIAEGFVRFATHNPHCKEIAEEIRSRIQKPDCRGVHQWEMLPAKDCPGVLVEICGVCGVDRVQEALKQSPGSEDIPS